MLISFPSTENQPQVFSRARSSWYSLISKFRADFPNLFGVITPWYVTPPPIQLLFVIMLYILSILLHYVSPKMLEKSIELSSLVDIDA